MKRFILISTVFLLLSKSGISQNIGINATGAIPDVSAMLDVVSTSKGLLIPRVALTGVNDAGTIATPQTGLLVWCTGGGGLSPAGFYYNSGTTGSPVWVQLLNGGTPTAPGTAWLVNGNNGITSANFIGPIDSIPLNFQITGNTAGTIDPSGPTFIGYKSGNNNTGTYNTGIGFKALYSNVAGNNGTAIGTNAMLYANSSAVSFSDYNVAVGFEALRGSSTPSSNTGNSNTAIGSQSLWSNTTGNNNVAIGVQALYSNTAGIQNTAIGTSTLYYNVAGNNSTAVGDGAMLYANSAGGGFTTYNTAIGFEALRGSNTQGNNTGINNTAIGFEALWSNTSGSSNAASGVNALFANTTGYSNTGFGYEALYTNTTGHGNTAVGDSADVSAVGLVDATAIGFKAKVTASDNMMFGDASVIGWGFGATPGAGKAIIVGTGNTNGNGAYLTTGGTWTSVSSKSIKDNITVLDGKEVLNKISRLEVARWRYIGTQEYHIGPFAEQFYDLFNTGLDNKAISSIDPSGVALIGIQQLIKENEELKSRITELETRLGKINEMQNQLDQMKLLIKNQTASNK